MTFTYGKLVAHHEDSIWLTADPHPAVLLHLLKDDPLQASIVIDEVLFVAPEQWIPAECQASLPFKLVIVKQHCVQTSHQEQVATVHNVLLDHRIGPWLAKFFQVGVENISAMARGEPCVVVRL